MSRRASLLAAAAFGLAVTAPAGMAQPDLEGLKTEGIENAKIDIGDMMLRLGFTFDRSDVPETVQFRLDAVAEELNQDRVGAKVEVAGHTDSVGDELYNQALSEKRAEAVRDYLIRLGVDGGRITVVGYGESAPRAGNDTIEGRRLNRRVEIRAIGG